MQPATIKPRLRWLQENGWNLERLANVQDQTLITSKEIAPNNQFGQARIVNLLVSRATELNKLEHGYLTEVLASKQNWDSRDLLRALMLLQKLSGVGLPAALHILMELHWGVVKPDRHISRFLSRLGGDWLEYFHEPNSDKVASEALVFMLEKWRSACRKLSELDGKTFMSSGVEFPSVGALVPRQIDYLIMWYSQNIEKKDREWRPDPICTRTPRCADCNVLDCDAQKVSP
jgi:hypothetical protein